MYLLRFQTSPQSSSSNTVEKFKVSSAIQGNLLIAYFTIPKERHGNMARKYWIKVRHKSCRVNLKCCSSVVSDNSTLPSRDSFLGWFSSCQDHDSSIVDILRSSIQPGFTFVASGNFLPEPPVFLWPSHRNYFATQCVSTEASETIGILQPLYSCILQESRTSFM